eukprot:SAG11_NODE_14156_length_623_cov_0.725191_2_plen_26_part_01
MSCVQPMSQQKQRLLRNHCNSELGWW